MKFEYYFATLRAALRKDDAEIGRIGGLVAAECEKAGQRDGARRVRQMLGAIGAATPIKAMPAELSKWVWWEESQTGLDSVRLSAMHRGKVQGVVTEFACADALAVEGFRPRHRVLLDGPSGTGKTKLARALAHALAVPFGLVRGGSLKASHVGETGENIDRLFQSLQQPCVVCFDEFDQIATKRGGTDHGADKEANSIVCVLLTVMERLPINVVMVATTNRPNAIDEAFLRRFDMRLTLEHPTASELALFAKDLASRWRHLGIDPRQLQLGHSYATAEAAVIDAARAIVIESAART